MWSHCQRALVTAAASALAQTACVRSKIITGSIVTITTSCDTEATQLLLPLLQPVWNSKSSFQRINYTHNWNFKQARIQPAVEMLQKLI